MTQPGSVTTSGKISYRSYLFSLAPSPTRSAFIVACLSLSGPPRSSQDSPAKHRSGLCCAAGRANSNSGYRWEARGSQMLGYSEEGRPGAGATLAPGPVAASFTLVGAARDEEGSLGSEDPTALRHQFLIQVAKSGSFSELGRSDTFRRKATPRTRAQQPPVSNPGILSRSAAQTPPCS